MSKRLRGVILIAVALMGCSHTPTGVAPRLEPAPEPWPIEAPQFPFEPHDTFRPCTMASGDERGDTTIWSYDEQGRPVLRVLELGGYASAVTHLRHDDAGGSVSKTQVFRWGRGGKPEPTQAVRRVLRGGGYETDPAGVTGWKTDDAGRLESRERVHWPLGSLERVVFQRDAEGRVIEKVTRTGEAFVSGVRMVWASDGRSVTFESESETAKGSQSPSTTAAKFDAQRRMIEVTYAGGRQTFHYDGPGGALSLHQVWKGETLSEETSASFDALGRVLVVAGRGLKTTFGYACHDEGVQTLALTPTGWSTKGKMEKTKREGVWETFDEKGRLVQQQEFRGGVREGKSVVFREDGSTWACTFVDDDSRGPCVDSKAP